MQATERTRNRAGFTLVELIVSLLIGSILITVVFQLLVGQTRTSGMQSAREEAQQNSRGALEILGSELRSVMPRGLLSAEAQSLTFMQPRAWGLLCAPVAAGTQIDVLFPAATSPGAWGVSDANGILIQQGADYFPARQANLAGSLSARARITGAQVLGAPGGVVCQNLAAQGNLQVVRVTSSVPLTGAQGDLVALYTLTRYDVATKDGELWLRRNGGMSAANTFNPQPLAGPIAPEPERFRLTYFNEAGVEVAPPGTNLAQLDAVRQIRFRVVTRSSQRVNGIAQRDSGEMQVLLRNN